MHIYKHAYMQAQPKTETSQHPHSYVSHTKVNGNKPLLRGVYDNCSVVCGWIKAHDTTFDIPLWSM